MTKFCMTLMAAFWMAGCSTLPPDGASDMLAEYGPFPDFGARDVRPDAIAPEWMSANAKAYHWRTRYASRYPHFEFCQRRPEAPGYEAKFTTAPGGRVGVTYYFDGQGTYLTYRLMLCAGI